MHGKQAEQVGGSSSRYFKAFGITFAVAIVAYAAAIAILFAVVFAAVPAVSGGAGAVGGEAELAAFCAQVQRMTAAGPDDSEELPALEAVIAVAPDEVAPDLDIVRTTFTGEPTGLSDAEINAAGERADTYIEDNCGIDVWPSF
ncbi:hypothetical protein ACWKWC_01605 [Geodermatophilus nigrescens]